MFFHTKLSANTLLEFFVVHCTEHEVISANHSARERSAFFVAKTSSHVWHVYNDIGAVRCVFIYTVEWCNLSAKIDFIWDEK
jgi:hypothetical protein